MPSDRMGLGQRGQGGGGSLSAVGEAVEIEVSQRFALSQYSCKSMSRKCQYLYFFTSKGYFCTSKVHAGRQEGDRACKTRLQKYQY